MPWTVLTSDGLIGCRECAEEDCALDRPGDGMTVEPGLLVRSTPPLLVRQSRGVVLLFLWYSLQDIHRFAVSRVD